MHRASAGRQSTLPGEYDSHIAATCTVFNRVKCEVVGTLSNYYNVGDNNIQ